MSWFFKMYILVIEQLPIPVAARSRAWDYNRSLAAIVGSNPADGM
jgi:hypothetical protein